MIHEYALDPDAISDWPSFRYFFDHFGVHTGRLISEFPGKWKRLVYQAVERGPATTIQRQSIVERLTTIDDKLFRQQRTYDGTVSWIKNALTQQPLEPFRAIITNNYPAGSNNCLGADGVDSTDPLWAVSTQAVLEREPEILAAAARTLLRHSAEVIFVDPHFKPGRRKWLRPLEEFIQNAIESGPSISRMEYHFKFDPAASPPFDAAFIAECQRRIAPVVPLGMTIKLIRWKKRPVGKSFHARLLLTNKGGIGFDYGLDEGDDRGDTTLVSILQPSTHKELWNDFQKHQDMTMCTYEFDNETVISGTKVV